MLNNLRRTWHWEKVKLHSSRIRSLLQDRVQADIQREKAMVLAINYEIVSNATRAMSALRKVEEIGVPTGLEREVQEIRSWLKDYLDLPAIPRREMDSTPQSTIGRLYGDYERLQGRFDEESNGQEEVQRFPDNVANPHQASMPSKEEQRGTRRLDRMAEDFDIPEDVIARKFKSYALTIQSSSQGSDWNADIDDEAREVGALTEEQIEGAKSNPLTAVVNRVKLALVMEGYIPGKPPKSSQ